ncbi:MAG: type II secretion system F family protein [Rhodospirillales bacterium]|nr:type II secretion system F family protein [Rhodospirillales bacterium]
MSPVILSGVGLCIVLVATGGMMLVAQLRQDAKFADRVRLARGQRPTLTREEREAKANVPARQVLLRLIGSVGQAIMRSGLLSKRTRAELEQTLMLSGANTSNGLALFVGSKLMLATLAPLLVWLAVRHSSLPVLLHIALPFLALVAGLMVPDYIARKRRATYLTALEAGLPDALDMMVICAQAGLGLGAIILRVGNELRYAHPEVAHELSVTADELQVMADARVALTNLGSRTGLENFRRLGTTMIQSMQYGTPLRDALRSLSAEMRQEAMTRLEARAARLPVLLTLPMVMFILPCLFMVVGGPAIIRVIRTLSAH